MVDQRRSFVGPIGGQQPTTANLSSQSNYAGMPGMGQSSGTNIHSNQGMKSQQNGATVQINNPISIYHVYFTQQS